MVIVVKLDFAWRMINKWHFDFDLLAVKSIFNTLFKSLKFFKNKELIQKMVLQLRLSILAQPMGRPKNRAGLGQYYLARNLPEFFLIKIGSGVGLQHKYI